MSERLWVEIDSEYDVPPQYAMDWLTDFRPEDMRSMDAKAPLITVTRLDDGRILREFAMMGMQMRTLTTLADHEWVAHVEVRDKKGKLQSLGRIVETVRARPGGTVHHVELHQDDKTLFSRVVTSLTAGIQKRQLRKLFQDQKAKMEEAYRAGKPATA